MRRFTILLISLLFVLACGAQKLTVESMEMDPFDRTASMKPVYDFNNNACGLIKVQLAVAGAKFGGNIIEPVNYDLGEYNVYMTEGSHLLKVRGPGFIPLMLDFRDYGIHHIEARCTYVLTLLLPQGALVSINTVGATPSAPHVGTSTTSSNSSTNSSMPVPDAVDLGLSVKWASCNLGASKPEEYGNYYKWGETEPADTKGWETYKYSKGKGNKITKYCTDSKRGYKRFTDGKTRLDLSDDAATVNLGASWRMPTYEELQELVDKCTHEWITIGLFTVGMRFTGPNGNTIFFPASGFRASEDGLIRCVGSNGYCWSASAFDSGSSNRLYLNTNFCTCHSSYRADAFPIRPVLAE